MLIYNNDNNNKVKFEKNHKIARSKQSHHSSKRDAKGTTSLKKVKSTKRKQLKKENIQFLKQLGFKIRKK